LSSLFKHENIKNRYNNEKHLFTNVNKISPLIDSISSLIKDDDAWNAELIDKLDNSVTGFVNRHTFEYTNYDCVKYNPNKNRN